MPVRVFGFVVLACTVAPLEAQVLRGVLIESGSALPVAAGLLQLLAAGDTVVVSVGTGERGRFAFPAVAPGRYRIRALRIGYRAWTSEPFLLAAGQTRGGDRRGPGGSRWGRPGPVAAAVVMLAAHRSTRQ